MGINYNSISGRNTAFGKEQPTVSKLSRLMQNGWDYIKYGHGKYLRFTVNMETGEVIRIERKGIIKSPYSRGGFTSKHEDISWGDIC